MIDGIVIVIIGFATMFAALSMPLAIEFDGIQAFMIGPGFLPALFGLILGILGLLRFYTSYKNRQPGKPIVNLAISDNYSKIVNYIILIIIFSAFVFSIGKFPFWLIIFVYFSVFYIYMYYKDITKMATIGKVALLSVGSSFLLSYVLPAVLQITLP